ncbi:hypothetical protein [Virgibacillus salexigens]|uniref:hypothetical protein n=1 Tax=Virgibacillus massiliensis TaxID=1462526 RepID=UPI001367E53E|nr:hypothetical protein [Virgibacillus massiliensis]MYL43923.1 hypothetical protein [Virgibacillus massiliensis]
MSISIDGKVHKGVLRVKYGEAFPVAKRSIELNNEDYGRVLVYILSLEQPRWTEKFAVEIPFRYYITDIILPNEKYLQNKRKSKLKVIK